MVEVRDARLPITSRHPLFNNWVREAAGTTIVVYTHADLLSCAEIAAVSSFKCPNPHNAIPYSMLFRIDEELPHKREIARITPKCIHKY